MISNLPRWQHALHFFLVLFCFVLFPSYHHSMYYLAMITHTFFITESTICTQPHHHPKAFKQKLNCFCKISTVTEAPVLFVIRTTVLGYFSFHAWDAVKFFFL